MVKANCIPPYTGPVRGVVFDWAGTTVDHGSVAPVHAFVEAFRLRGIVLSLDETRGPMGRAKLEHVRALLELQPVIERWRHAFGHSPSERDAQSIYADLEPLLLDCVGRSSSPIAGVPEAVADLRARGLRIGSSTGYTAPMLAVVAAAAAREGYAPDALVCASDVPAGRPKPWMCFLNAQKLDLYPMASLVKVGDTVADVEEGRNAGMWTVGVAATGNEVGLTRDELAGLEPAVRRDRIAGARARLLAAGAHFVVDSAADTGEVVDEVERRLKDGENP